MDATLAEKFKDSAKDQGIKLDRVNDENGELKLVRSDRSESYTLKPLNELFGKGSGQSVDPKNDAFMPLFLSVEEEIVNFDSNEELLTDGRVALVLGGLSMNPETPSIDPLGKHLQDRLRLVLSLNDYSRQELRQVLRKIEKSVARHTESGGGRGYINFIRRYFAR